MALTQPQLVALKAYIDSVPALAAYPLGGDGPYELTLRLNTEIVTPDYFVWKEVVTVEEIQNNGFAWIEVDNLTVGKARIWEWELLRPGVMNPAKQNVRAGIAECWSGNAGRVAVQGVIFGHCMKKANHIEKLFAVASLAPPALSGNLGTSTNVATAAVVGVTQGEVETARSIP